MREETRNPFDRLGTDTLDRRLGRESQAKASASRGAPRRTTRPAQIAIKTTELTRQRLERLSVWLEKSKVEVIEIALEDLEERLKAEAKAAG
jgi:hypothetical protein